MNDDKKTKVTIIILLSIIVVLVFLLSIITILYFNKKCNCVSNEETTTSTTNSTEPTSTPPDIIKEHEVHRLLLEYGKEYYKSMYPYLVKKQIESFEEDGIETDLNSIIYYYEIDLKQDIASEFMINGKEFADRKETKIIFYPKEPYGEEDVDIRIDAKYNR